MANQLTIGALSKISSGELQPEDVQPVVEVVDIQLVQTNTSNTSAERYRLMLSDGSGKMQGMLATQCNELIRSHKLQKGSIVQLLEYVVNTISGRKLIIINNVDVIVEQCDISNTRQSLYNSGSEPNTVRSPAPMQSINQASTISGLQLFTSSVSRSILTATSPSYPPAIPQQQNTSLYSHGMRPPANSYGHPVQPTYNQSRPMIMNRGPTSKNEARTKIMPIAALNPYQGMWTIKVRVTAKAELRLYNNAKGDGKVFYFDLLDSDGGEIKTTCFNHVADQFYSQIEVGKVYIISRGSVKPAQKGFNHLKNDHEILLDSTSTIQPCDEDRSIPLQQYHFRSIAELSSLNHNTILDIIGVVIKINPLGSLLKKDGTETLKRTLLIKDMSSNSVEVTLWGNFCNREGLQLQTLCDSGVFPILVMKTARVSDFNGKTVGTISTTQLSVNPDIPEACNLRTWFDSIGKNTSSVSLTTFTTHTDVWKTISQIKDEELGRSEKPDWITVSATIPFLKLDNFYYTACPSNKGDRQCNKKVTNNGDGKWHCDSCNQSFDICDYRYILSFHIQDHTGIAYVTAFQEQGEAIMGVSAKELHSLRYEEPDEERTAEMIKNVSQTKYNFKLKVKEQIYQEETRVKLTIVKVERIGFSSDTKRLLDLLKKEVPSSVVPEIETPIGFQESARYSSSYMGGATGLPPANQMGHNSMSYPSVGNASGGRFNSVPSGGGNRGDCYKCHQPGHWARDCPNVKNSSSAYGSGNVGGNKYGDSTGQFVGY